MLSPFPYCIFQWCQTTALQVNIFPQNYCICAVLDFPNKTDANKTLFEKEKKKRSGSQEKRRIVQENL